MKYIINQLRQSAHSHDNTETRRCFYILLILTFTQNFLLTSLNFNLVTVWLVYIFARLPTGPGVLALVTASWLLETHASLPMGNYFAAYGITFMLMRHIRQNLSWSQNFSWLLSCCFAECIVVGYELIALGATGLEVSFTPEHILVLVARIAITTWLGAILIRAYDISRPQEVVSE